MKTLVLYAHPARKSFNRQVLRKVEEALEERDYEYEVRDLYALGFNPVLSQTDIDSIKFQKTPDDVRVEQELITWADQIILIFPLWWGGMPAILRGYIDRVFSYGFAYRFDEVGSIGLLQGKRAIVLCSTGTSVEEMELTGLASSIRQIMKESILEFCGLEVVAFNFLSAVSSVEEEMREAYFSEIKKVLV
ncbi:MAG: NAD(P)H-dependent oxidoreductase [Bacteroidota bacterium]|nr:NAD(P)H-dependent oxidoreductase [Bacteroidota bacterium]MDP4205806.1 NAD(P)H-dependent oxidoreductase [Bacteroidota bacterium]